MTSCAPLEAIVLVSVIVEVATGMTVVTTWTWADWVMVEKTVVKIVTFLVEVLTAEPGTSGLGVSEAELSIVVDCVGGGSIEVVSGIAASAVSDSAVLSDSNDVVVPASDDVVSTVEGTLFVETVAEGSAALNEKGVAVSKIWNVRRPGPSAVGSPGVSATTLELTSRDVVVGSSEVATVIVSEATAAPGELMFAGRLAPALNAASPFCRFNFEVEPQSEN